MADLGAPNRRDNATGAIRPWQVILGTLFVIGVPMAFFIHLATGWTLL